MRLVQGVSACGARQSQVEVAALLSTVFSVRILPSGQYEYRGANVLCPGPSHRYVYKCIKLVTDRKLRDDLVNGFVLWPGGSSDLTAFYRWTETSSHDWKTIDMRTDLQERTQLSLSDHAAQPLLFLLELYNIAPEHAIAVHNLLLDIDESELMTQLDIESFESLQAQDVERSRDKANASAQTECYVAPHVGLHKDLADYQRRRVGKAVCRALKNFRPPTGPIETRSTPRDEPNPLESDHWQSVLARACKLAGRRWKCQTENWFKTTAIPLAHAKSPNSCRLYAAQHLDEGIWESTAKMGSSREMAFAKWCEERTGNAKRMPTSSSPNSWRD